MLFVMRKPLIGVGACLLLAPAAWGQVGQQSPPPGLGVGTGSEAAIEAAHKNAKVIDLYNEKKYDEALPAAESAVAQTELAYGAESWRVGDSVTSLAEIRAVRKEYAEAAKQFRRALSIYVVSNGADSPPVLRTLRRLVVVSYSAGEPDGVQDYAGRALSLAASGPDSVRIETARPVIRVTEMFRMQAETKRALALYPLILAAAEKVDPQGIPEDLVGSLGNYLGVLYAQGAADDSPEVVRIGRLLLGVAAARPVKEGRYDAGAGGTLGGRAAYKPQPEYPPAAKSKGERGAVVVEVTVDEVGKVIEARAVEGKSENLRAAAEAAARRWRFAPTLIAGVPVKSSGRITFNFKGGR